MWKVSISLCVTVMVSLQPVLTDTLLDLSCQTDLDCVQFIDEPAGKNATCLQKTCLCFDQHKTNIDCKPANVLSYNKIHGPCPCNIPKAHCDTKANECVCDNDFIPSLDKRRCIKAILRLNMTCEDDSQCLKYDNHAECDLSSRICACQKNYTQYEKACHSQIPLGENCVSDDQCSGRVENSLCHERQCICKKGFVANQNGTRCLAGANFADMCTESAQCQLKLGVGSLCDSGVCVCNTQYRKVGEKDEDLGCIKIVAHGDICYEHTDCYKFDAVDQPMECFQNQCICRRGYDNDNDPAECVRTHSSASEFLICMPALIFLMAGVLLS